jgi:hypothetical protein
LALTHWTLAASSSSSPSTSLRSTCSRGLDRPALSSTTTGTCVQVKYACWCVLLWQCQVCLLVRAPLDIQSNHILSLVHGRASQRLACASARALRTIDVGSRAACNECAAVMSHTKCMALRTNCRSLVEERTSAEHHEDKCRASRGQVPSITRTSAEHHEDKCRASRGQVPSITNAQMQHTSKHMHMRLNTHIHDKHKRTHTLTTS